MKHYAASIIQNAFRKSHKLNRVREGIDYNAEENPEFHDLVVNALDQRGIVVRSTDADAVNEVVELVKSGQWDHEKLLDHWKLPQCALTAFMQKHITLSDFTFLMLRFKAKRDQFEIKNTYPIFDDEGKYTEEAKFYFFPHFHEQDENDWEVLKAAIQKLPMHQQCFSVAIYHTDKFRETFDLLLDAETLSTNGIPKFVVDGHKFEMDETFFNALENGMENGNSTDWRFAIPHLALQNTVMLEIYGDKVVKPHPKLGLLTTQDFENDLWANKRPGDLWFSNSVRHLKEAHTGKWIPFAMYGHDINHAIVETSEIWKRHFVGLVIKAFRTIPKQIKDQHSSIVKEEVELLTINPGKCLFHISPPLSPQA